jgi:altronate dehydratase small subunit
MAAAAGTKIDAIMVSDTDNVATCLNDIAADTDAAVMLGKEIFTVRAGQDIPRGHKLAVAPIITGSAIVKYGEVIGKASADITRGAHVHVHNVVD